MQCGDDRKNRQCELWLPKLGNQSWNYINGNGIINILEPIYLVNIDKISTLIREFLNFLILD